MSTIRPYQGIARKFSIITIFLLIGLWSYAGISKLANFSHTELSMAKQIFSPAISQLLSWMIPVTELVTAILLLFPLTQAAGVWISLLLLGSFSAYVFAGWLHLFTRTPCSCGGVLEHMGWGTHLLFNLFFLTLTLVTIFINHKKKEVRDI